MGLAVNRLKLLLPYILSHKKQLIIGSVCLIIVSLLALPTPYLMKYIIDEVLAKKNLRLLNIIVLLLVFLPHQLSFWDLWPGSFNQPQEEPFPTSP